MKLSLLSNLAMLVASVTAVAVVPKPSTVDGTLARQLRQKQTNRHDIARRAQEHAGMEKRQAAPSVGLGGRCGGQPQGVEFYLYSLDEQTGRETYGKYTRAGTNPEFGFLTVTSNANEAIPFIFDKQCRLRGASGPGQAFTLNSDTSIIMMGNDASVDKGHANGYNPITCRASNGALTCTNEIVPSNGLLCNYANSYLWFTTSAGAESTGCVPIDLRIRRYL